MFKINAVANSSRFCLSMIIFFVSAEMRSDKNARAADGLGVFGSLLHHQLQFHRLLKAAIRQGCLSHIYELVNLPVPFVIPSPGSAGAEPELMQEDEALLHPCWCLALCKCHPGQGDKELCAGAGEVVTAPQEMDGAVMSSKSAPLILMSFIFFFIFATIYR